MLTLIIGGAASGKSEYAEALIKEMIAGRAVRGIYLATMRHSPKAEARIRKHVERRKEMGLFTVEDPELSESSPELYPPGCVILLEDLPNLMANRMFSETGEVREQVAVRLAEDLIRLSERAEHMILVSGDLFRDGKDYSDETKKYVKNLGEIHRLLRMRADRVVEVVCGIPIDR